MQSMINPNGDELGQNDPLTGSTKPAGQQFPHVPTTGVSQVPGGEAAPSPTMGSRFQDAGDKVSSAASDAWQQTKETATVAKQRTEFFMRENPVPTVIGALAVGLAIGLAIRYSSERAEREREYEAKTPFGDINLGVLSLPFLWPFFKSVRRRYEDSAEMVKDNVKEGVDRLKNVDVDQYVKPLRKKWRAWTN